MILRRKIPLKPWVFALLAAAVGFFLYFEILFFLNLSSTLSGRSSGDSIYHVQIFHNLIYGNPLQTTTAWVFFKDPVRMVYDPNAFVSQTGVHVNFTGFLFAPLFVLYPHLQGLQAIIQAVNYLGILVFGFLILKELGRERLKERFALFSAIVLASNAMFVIQFEMHQLLFSTPFILGVYYAWLKRSRWGFALACVLLCGVSEDSAIFLGGFSVYLFFFEKDRRRWAVASGLFAAVYALFAIRVLQPAARWDMVGMQASHLDHAVQGLDLSFPKLLGSAKSETRLIRKFAFSLVVPLLLISPVRGVDWKRVLGLCIVAPMVQWPIIVILDANHRLIPIYACWFLALMVLLSAKQSVVDAQGKVPAWRTGVAVAVFAWVSMTAFLLLREVNYPVLWRHEKGSTEWASLDSKRVSNEAVIEAIRSIPKERSVTYQTAFTVEAFLPERSRIWRYPKYFDLSDFTVVQKNHAFHPVKFRQFDPEQSNLKDFNQALERNPEAFPQVILNSREEVIRHLVRIRKTHRVVRDDAEVLILERLKPYAFEMPDSTVGLGYLKNIPKVLRKYMRPS